MAALTAKSLLGNVLSAPWPLSCPARPIWNGDWTLCAGTPVKPNRAAVSLTRQRD